MIPPHPGFPLNFASAIRDKISLFGNAGNHDGLGIQASVLQIPARSRYGFADA